MIRHTSVIIGNALAGLGGASLVIGYLGNYATGDSFVSGRGWIAIVVVVLAGWSPFIAILGSWVFGLGYAIASVFIGTGAVTALLGPGSGYFMLAVPYIFAIIAILLYRKRTKPPSSLTIPYKRK
ncbi:MAG: hypothetical protein QXG05_03275 [Nitrososphaerota archaeon]